MLREARTSRQEGRGGAEHRHRKPPPHSFGAVEKIREATRSTPHVHCYDRCASILLELREGGEVLIPKEQVVAVRPRIELQPAGARDIGT
eukprot:CAMPEP_0115742592 /NCGR_PEP_ID=MMETSP0272-20121206/90612_1 /TAXON_ID=71861 /ORGANISM="Scrippsiella trochoidea, Strain CCMP3099" /LENGTH=89 /DNA_ID=CAMNT_0003187329 /DNA_START=65 /DNA_END=330 /DNA_ORIENTATION=-